MARFATPLALVGGALLGIAFSVEWAWPGAIVAVASWILCLEATSSHGESAFRSALFGWAGYVGGFFWLQPALASFWGGREALSWALWIAWGCWVALRFVVIGVSYRALRARQLGMLPSVVLPWLAVEWLYPSVFPFYLANPFIDLTLLTQVAALGGPLLLSAWVCGVSVLLAACVKWLDERTPVRRAEWLTVLSATVAIVAYGATSMSWQGQRALAARSIRVGVVQANVDVMKKRTERVLSHRRHLDLSQALDAEVDLLIWPETSYLHALPAALPTSGAAVRGSLRSPLLFGGVRKDPSSRRFNSALMVDADGTIRDAYDKRFLIPFAEFIPLGDRLPWWERSAPTLSRFHAGDADAALRLGDWRIATPICYETIRPGFVRALVRATAPNLLVSLANDGWFGDTPEPRIHLRLARFRAIEHRRYLVRATNTGITAIVDPLGRVVSETETFEVATLVGEVRMLDGRTVYAWLGDWPGYLSAAAIMIMLVVRRRRNPARRRQHQ